MIVEGRVPRVGLVGVTLRRAFIFAAVVARVFGERYRGLNGWKVEAVARVGPPA